MFGSWSWWFVSKLFDLQRSICYSKLNKLFTFWFDIIQYREWLLLLNCLKFFIIIQIWVRPIRTSMSHNVFNNVIVVVVFSWRVLPMGRLVVSLKDNRFVFIFLYLLFFFTFIFSLYFNLFWCQPRAPFVLHFLNTLAQFSKNSEACKFNNQKL